MTPGGSASARRRRDHILGVVAACVLYSLLLHALVLGVGLHRAPDAAVRGFATFYDRPNWWAGPVFFLLLAPALLLSWRPLLDCWRKLADTGVLRAEGEINRALLDELERTIAGKRWIAVAAALVVAGGINAVDLPAQYAIHRLDRHADQLASACRDPDFSNKWILDAWAAAHSEQPPCGAGAALPEALVLAGEEPAVAAPWGHRLVMFVAYGQQILLVLLGALAFCQLFLHTALFALFERLAFARANRLSLRLNSASPLHEFGLEHWNHALNNLYWAFSPALVAPFVSRASVADPALYYPGQRMFNIFVPIIVLAPMVATVIARQIRLPAAWAELAPRGPLDPACYLEQRLWPLDRNWASKLGIVLAIAVAGLVLGIEIGDLVRL